MKRLTIAILNWNGAKMLEQFLPSVCKYSVHDDVEICIIDNASTDTSSTVVATQFPSIKWIQLPENYGFAEGYNKGIKKLSTPYVLLLNSDVEVTEGWLTPLINYMEEHPEAVACQPKICAYHHKAYYEYAGAAGGFIDKWGYPFCRGRIFDTIEKVSEKYEEAIPVFWATGAALLVRREAYEEVGGLDAHFFAHMEEIDLCWRWQLRGYEIACVPQSTVYHVGGGTLKKESPKKTYLNFRNNLLMLYKNLPKERMKHVYRVRLILDFVAMLHFLFQGNGRNALAVYEAHRDYRKQRKRYDSGVRVEKQLSDNLKGFKKYSILWQYYVCGRKNYDKLPIMKD